jgi:ubiquitin-conjugating enzyme E2 H
MDNPISTKRIARDIEKLQQKVANVKIIKNKQHELTFTLIGPKDTCYEGGVFTVYVYIPPTYPFKSPSIAFHTTVFHPNVDELTGAICLDVINEKWSPTYSLLNIHDLFLPQLLTYPNPDDPLNKYAADIYINNKRVFASKVKEYIIKYCRVI